ncbi:MAG: transposase [Chloracidobacterium sp.]|nr:transposase [Chloracidobacterium sp.]
MERSEGENKFPVRRRRRVAVESRSRRAYSSQVCPSCGYLSKANRQADSFQCQKCGRGPCRCDRSD